MMWAGVSLHHKTNIVFINGNLTAARYQHETLDKSYYIVEKPQRNAVAAGWCSSLSDKGHHYISEHKQRKCRRLPPKSPDLNIVENILDELHVNRRVRRTGAISTTLNQLRRVEQHASELRSALCDVNETPLSCRSEQCGGHTYYTKFTRTWTPLQDLT